MAGTQKTLSKDLKELRDCLRLTQEQLARILGVSVTTVSRWEQGLTEPRRDQEDAIKTLMELKDKSEAERKMVQRKLLLATTAGISIGGLLPLGLKALMGALSAASFQPFLNAIFAADWKDAEEKKDGKQ